MMINDNDSKPLGFLVSLKFYKNLKLIHEYNLRGHSYGPFRIAVSETSATLSG